MSLLLAAVAPRWLKWRSDPTLEPLRRPRLPSALRVLEQDRTSCCDLRNPFSVIPVSSPRHMVATSERSQRCPKAPTLENEVFADLFSEHQDLYPSFLLELLHGCPRNLLSAISEQ